MMKPLFAFLALAATASLLPAKERKIELPKEIPSYPPGKGSALFSGHCLACHSAEYISTQPKMPRKFWEGMVLKMKDKFGAPIPDASVQELTDYLTTHFGK